MPFRSGVLLDFFQNSLGRILIVLGAFCVLVAVLLVTRVYQWASSLSFFFGVVLIVVGTALHFESFRWKVPSLEGVGTILIYVSPLFFAAAVVAATFAVPTEIVTAPAYGSSKAVDEHGSPIAWISKATENFFVSMSLGRPNFWLATPFMLTGLGLLAVGCLLKFARDVF